MTLYEAIFKRRSVRRYKKEPLPPEFFKNLRKFERGLQPLNSAIPYSVEIIDALSQETKVRGLFRVKAPYYLVFFSEPGEEAEKNAVRVPDDLAVIGFDDIAASRFFTPALSSVSLHLGTIGKVAAELLERQLRGKTHLPPEIVPCDLVLRQST